MICSAIQSFGHPSRTRSTIDRGILIVFSVLTQFKTNSYCHTFVQIEDKNQSLIESKCPTVTNPTPHRQRQQKQQTQQAGLRPPKTTQTQIPIQIQTLLILIQMITI